MDYKAATSLAKNRKTTADKIESTAKRYGWHVKRHEEGRRIAMTIYHGPYAVGVALDGASKVGAFLANWVTYGPASYPQNFIGGVVNRFHGRKATMAENTFDDFLNRLRYGFDQLSHT